MGRAAPTPTGQAAPSPTVSRRGRLLLAAGLAAYVAGYLAWPPTFPIISDERAYLAQAQAFADLRADAEVPGSLAEPAPRAPPSHYAPGTSLLQAPLVALLGWPGAPLLSLLCLVALALVTARLLEADGRAAGWALLVVAFLPAAALGRTAMGDVPAALAVALMAWAAWRPAAGAGAALLAGLLGGAALLFRETSAVVVAPLLLARAWRQPRAAAPLLLGLGLGVGVRLWAAWALHGDPLFVKGAYPFSLAALPWGLLLHGLALTLLLPGGLPAALLDGGPRARQVRTATLGALFLFACYTYTAAESGGARRLVLAPRYLLPLAPLLAVSVARAADRLRARWPWTGRAWAAAAGVAIAGLVAVHPVLHRLAEDRRRLAQALADGTVEGELVLIDRHETAKYLGEPGAPRRWADVEPFEAERLRALRAAGRPVSLAHASRGDTAWHRERRERFLAEVARLGAACKLVPQPPWEGTAGDRLERWRVGDCGP